MDNWTIMDSALEALGQNDKADVEHYIRELGRENSELRKDKERMDWIDKTVDGLSRRIVDSEMEDEWIQDERRQTWLREE